MTPAGRAVTEKEGAVAAGSEVPAMRGEAGDPGFQRTRVPGVRLDARPAEELQGDGAIANVLQPRILRPERQADAMALLPRQELGRRIEAQDRGAQASGGGDTRVPMLVERQQDSDRRVGAGLRKHDQRTGPQL